MANADKPRGMWPIRRKGGGPIETEEVEISSSTGTVLYLGDIVTQEATGNIEAAAANDGVSVIGVFAGCRYIDANGKPVYSKTMPATKTSLTNMVALIWNARDYIFGIQADTDATAPASIAVIGATANHSAGSGNATTQLSGHELDTDDIGTGLQLRILRLVKRPDNAWGPHADLEVEFNEHNGHSGSASI